LDFSRLNSQRTLIGAIASAVLVLSLLFLPWYSVENNPQRDSASADFNPDAFICGTSDFDCTGFETFPILRWLLLLAAIAPAILAYILIRGHKTSYPPGEITMLAGFAATVLIAYNGIIDKPGKTIAEAGISLDFGYWLALLAAIGIGAVGYLRSLDSGGRQQRKAPGTV
jgi:hypothetical protein